MEEQIYCGEYLEFEVGKKRRNIRNKVKPKKNVCESVLPTLKHCICMRKQIFLLLRILANFIDNIFYNFFVVVY